MVYLLKMVIFHGYVSHNQRVYLSDIQGSFPRHCTHCTCPYFNWRSVICWVKPSPILIVCYANFFTIDHNISHTYIYIYIILYIYIQSLSEKLVFNLDGVSSFSPTIANFDQFWGPKGSTLFNARSMIYGPKDSWDLSW